MHTRKEERIVYIIGVIGTLAIFILNLKSGFSADAFLAILKDLSPLAISIMIFYLVNGLFHSTDFEKAANKAIEVVLQKYSEIFDKEIVKIRQKHAVANPDEDVDKTKKGNAEECLFFAKPKTSFIPLKELREGKLEIRVTYGTLANFEKMSPKETEEEKNRKKIEKRILVKKKTIETLQSKGAMFSVVIDNKNPNSAVEIQFGKQSNYQRIVVDVIEAVINLLKSGSDEKTEDTNV